MDMEQFLIDLILDIRVELYRCFFANKNYF